MVKLLDCTIRDGGHLNGWNFTEECVRATYEAAVKAGMEYFEIGYRFQNPKPEWGKFATCEDDFLLNLFTPDKNCKISVMINAGKCGADKFRECNPTLTPISFVRVATYPQNTDIAIRLCEELKGKGYNIFLNLMAITEYSEENFQKLAHWKNKNILESIYFADSFGSFLPQDVTKYHNKLKSLGFDKISFHSHNNLQMAFANSIQAINEDIYCIDASVYGMGRAAGNLPSEIITAYLKDKYNPVAYLELIEQYYLELEKQTPWGYKLQSLIGGLKNIHPNYVNELFKNEYSIDEIWTATDLIKKHAPISFDKDEMSNILSKKFIHNKK